MLKSKFIRRRRRSRSKSAGRQPDSPEHLIEPPQEFSNAQSATEPPAENSNQEVVETDKQTTEVEMRTKKTDKSGEHYFKPST